MKYEFLPKISLDAPINPTGATRAIAFVVGEKKKLSATASQFNKQSNNALQHALNVMNFTGKMGEVISFLAPAGHAYTYVMIGGIGKEKDATTHSFEKVGGALVKEAQRLRVESLVISAEGSGSKLDDVDAAAHMLFGARLRNYRFDKYRTTQKPDEKLSLLSVTVAGIEVKAAKKAALRLDALAEGITLTRDIVSEPANILYPETLAAVCKTLAPLGVKVEIMGEEQMRKLGMGSLLGVGQGSERESQMVVMRWEGADKKDAPVAFVGKGVTFDTGGISIKPAKGMEEMKWDMGGAGTVIGLMKALALRKAKVNVVGAVGLVENMPDGNAQRPGDVVTSMSGQTIEVLNTDAEGRLVLADVLWYVQDRFKPQFIVDLATLTGAIIVALGHERAGLFSNNDKLAERLHSVGEATGERLWRLPLGEEYDKQINSDIADMQNIGADREAGSITAAQFLQRFVNDVPWAHLDIAGTAWSKKDHAICPKGATGFGIRLLNALLETHYEK
ncbi:MAG: leucyl aminopeptidase [Rickettsiales bacterium]|nr:leucyl aminopeptidase [Rickettsiales bacterium]